MSILVETPEEDFDPNQGVTVDPKPRSTEPVVSEKELNEFTVPEKFKGKTAEEIAQSYVALESEVGRLRNDLGDYRSLTDRFLTLEEKRADDLSKAGQEDFEIDPTELLSNPDKVLDKYYDHRRQSDPEFHALQERLDRLEGAVSQNVLTSKHQDANEVTSDPEFLRWVQSQPYRQRIAQEAVQTRDIEALDYLLTEWKSRSGSQEPSRQPSEQEQEIRAARSVITETSSSGNATQSPGKVYSRKRLIDLRVRNPEEYSAIAEDVLRAYNEGRVVD